jgi:hypothetical protein
MRLSRRAWLAGVLVCWACITPAQRREDTLVREARMFNDDLRWTRWESMTAAMPKEDAAAFLGRVSAVEKEIELADYEVTSITFGPRSETATVAVKLDWFWRRDMLLKSTHLEQAWEQRNGRWTMVKQRRTRGERFPLVTEPQPAP